MIKKCSSCLHYLKDWDDEPCTTCDVRQNWEPIVPAADSLATEVQNDVGVKFDTGKPRTDLLPPEALLAAARVLTQGAAKYGERNWEKGLDLHRVYAAVLRHLFAWAKGEDINTEDGVETHLAHALTGLMMMVTLDERSEKDA